MGAPDFLIVPQHVARNPVARAVARKRQHDAVRDFLIQVYSLEDGAIVHAEISAAARVVAVAMRVLQARAETIGDTAWQHAVAPRVMTGGMGAMAQCSSRGWRWRTLDAVAIDRALQEAQAIIKTATAAETQAAWLYVENLK